MKLLVRIRNSRYRCKNKFTSYNIQCGEAYILQNKQKQP